MKEKKFTAMFHKYNRLVRKMVLERTGDLQLSEEICQQVFMSYFEKMEYIADELVQPWLLLTTKNRIYDYYRKQSKRRDILSTDLLKGVEIVCRDNAEVMIQRIANVQLTEKILTELYLYNRKWYDVIETVCVLGMSGKEAAKHLGISEEMLRARLSRARKYIRQKYGEEYSEL